VLHLASELRKSREAGERGISAGSLVLGALCLLVVPVVVYAASWAPMIASGASGIAAVADRHLLMYRYHSAIAETRWYASPWWQWPLDIRPIWLFEGAAAARVTSIVSMGNPAVFWAGTAAIPAAALLAIARRDRAAAWILAAFLTAWLPWAVASRSLTFIYHFLPASPFMILALALCLGRLAERFPRLRAAVLVYAGAVVVLFALFLPLLAGIPVRRGYAEALQWLGTWIFVAPGAGA
jgi:dolichyl-phosphate-mannose-protein mannosyltransferase